MAVQAGVIQTQLAADVGQFTAGMRAAQRAFDQTVSSLQSGSKRIQQGMKSSVDSTDELVGAVRKLQSTFQRGMAAIGAGFILPSILQKAKSAIIDFNQQLDSSTIAMEHFVGTKEGAKDLLKQLQDFAARTPFNFQDLLGTTQQMMAMGVEAKDLLPRLTAIGDAAAGLGGSPEILQRVQRALGQIQAKGRAQAEELMQLAEVGIPAYEYIAQLTGGDIPAALDKMRKGQVDAASAITALLDGMARDFGGMMQSQSQTMMGALSTVQDYAQMTIAKLGRPIFDAVRDTMLKVATFLSSPQMTQAASNFAEGFANALKAVGKMGSTLFKELQPTLKKLWEIGKTVASGFAKGFGSVQTIVAAAAAAFVGVGKALGGILAIAGPIIDFLAKNKTLATALVALWAALEIKMKLFGTSADGVAKIGTKLAESVKKLAVSAAQATTGTLGASSATKVWTDNIKATDKAVADGVKNVKGWGSTVSNIRKDFKAFDEARQMMNGLTNTMLQGDPAISNFALKAKLAGLQLKALGAEIAAAMLPLLAWTAAITAGTAIYTAYRNRNKDLTDRTKEFTTALRDNTTELLNNKDALQKGADGSDTLVKSFEQNKDVANKLTQSFGTLGEAYSFDKFVEFADGFDKKAKEMLKSSGLTKDEINLLVDAVNEVDKGASWWGRTDLKGELNLIDGITSETKSKMLVLGKALEEIQDQIENTDFTKVAQSAAQAAIGAGQVSIEMVGAAEAFAETKAETEGLSESQKALAFNQELMRLATDQQRLALQRAAEWSGEFEARLAALNGQQTRIIGPMTSFGDIMEILASQTEDGTVTLEAFTDALMGDKAAMIAWKRELASSRSNFEGLIYSFEGAEVSASNLEMAAFDLADQLAAVQFNGMQLGRTQQELDIEMGAMIANFRNAAVASGYTNDKVIELVNSLGLLNRLDPRINIAVNLDVAGVTARIQTILKHLQVASQRGGEAVSALMREQLAFWQSMLTAFSSVPSYTPSRGSGGGGGGGGGGGSSGQDWFKDWLGGLRDWASSYISGDFAMSLAEMTGGEVLDAFNNLINEALDMSMNTLAPKVFEQLKGLEGKFKELSGLADVRQQLIAKIDEAAAALDDLKQAYVDVRYEAGAFDSTIADSLTIEETTLDKARQAYQTLSDMISERDNLVSQAQSYAMNLAQSMMSPLSSTSSPLGSSEKVLRQAQDYLKGITGLRDRGFPPDIINEVVRAGMVDGGRLAKKLLSMSGSDMQKLLSVREQIASVAAEAGTVAADVIFGADIATANSAITEQTALVKTLYANAVAEAKDAITKQENLIKSLEGTLGAVNNQIAQLINTIQTSMHSTMFSFLSGFKDAVDGLVAPETWQTVANAVNTGSVLPSNNNITVNITGSVMSESDMIEAIRLGLLQAQAQGRPVVLT